MVHRHILLQTFPSLGGLNPSLEFARNLARIGVKVTVLVSLSVQPRIEKEDVAAMKIVTFSDGYDEGPNIGPKFDYDDFVFQLKTRGSKAISEVITCSAQEGVPVTGLVYVMLQTWAAKVAHSFNIPSAALWVQPASIFDIYYYYFYGYSDAIRRTIDDPSSQVSLLGLPSLTSRDLPSFMLPSNPISFNQLPAFKEQMETLDLEKKPKVLVNTFDELEWKALRAIDRYNLIAVGPLVPSAFLDVKDSSGTSCEVQKSKDKILAWLDMKAENSVVYVAFGSFVPMQEGQMEEISLGLIKSGRPFLWVVRAKDNGEKGEDKLSCKEELDKLGMIVPWCSQVEVLAHPSLGCFVTHCGWNSSLESLVSGVPVVGVPQFTDQPTNAKLLQDEFKVGVRAKGNENGVIERDEMKRCIDLVMECDEIRKNAKKWKNLAKEATKDGGSSYMNLKVFVNEFE